MARTYTRVHRLLRILTLIQSNTGWDARKLADECGTTERNIYRDLKMLEGAGVPCFFDPETGGYRIRGDFFMPPVELTLEESLALIALADQVGGDDQIAFTRPAAQAATKLRSQLPGAIREQVGQVDRQIEIRLARSMPPEGVADVYGTMLNAIARRRALRCSYESPARRGRVDQDGEVFTFRPYCLFWGQRAWYAVGHHSGHNEVRQLKLNRFIRLEQTQTPYAIPDDFSLKTFHGKAWRMMRGDRLYKVELHFDADFAETVTDTHWHDTQEVEWLDDGSILIRFEVAGLDEIVWWVLSMGPHCVVRKPRELAERVRLLAQQTAARYSASSSRRSSAKSRLPRTWPAEGLPPSPPARKASMGPRPAKPRKTLRVSADHHPR